jgi:hypothetical protein
LLDEDVGTLDKHEEADLGDRYPKMIVHATCFMAGLDLEKTFS